MVLRTPRLFTTAWLLLTIPPVLSLTTVSIYNLLPNNGHSCVPDCILNGYSSGIGRVLNCGSPYANDCFCNTGASSAAAATSWLSNCASTDCAAGDLSDDLTSMQSIYASYCIGAGFTQPGATDWYNPASTTANPAKSSSANPGQQTTTTTTANPGQTATSGPGQTTTQITVVTQTALSTGNSAATQPQVIVQTTSTFFISPTGAALYDSGPSKLALGVGLGIGIPLVLIAAVVALWLCLRSRRRRRQRGSLRPEALQPPMMQQQQQSVVSEQVLPPVAAPLPSSQIPRKAVAMQSPSASFQTTELTGDGVRRELSAREAHLAPSPISPSSPVAMARGHEMSGESQAGELPGQAGSPPPDYRHAVASQPGLGEHAPGQVGEPRWELG